MKSAAQTPRRIPTQARARATYRDVLDSASSILIVDGYDQASTNRIAKAAGVSVGTLYQYFPNKEAVFEAVVARHHAGFTERLAEARAVAEATGLEPRRAWVRGLLSAFAHSPRLTRALEEELPRVGQLASVDRVRSLAAAYPPAGIDAARWHQVSTAVVAWILAGFDVGGTTPTEAQLAADVERLLA